MNRLLNVAALLLLATGACASDSVGYWRYDDAAGTLGLRLNTDGSCSGLVGPSNGRAHVVSCTYRVHGPKVSVTWHFLEGRPDPRVPSGFVFLSEEGTLIAEGVPDMPLKRVSTVWQFLER